MGSGTSNHKHKLFPLTVNISNLHMQAFENWQGVVDVTIMSSGHDLVKVYGKTRLYRRYITKSTRHSCFSNYLRMQIRSSPH